MKNVVKKKRTQADSIGILNISRASPTPVPIKPMMHTCKIKNIQKSNLETTFGMHVCLMNIADTVIP